MKSATPLRSAAIITQVFYLRTLVQGLQTLDLWLLPDPFCPCELSDFFSTSQLWSIICFWSWSLLLPQYICTACLSFTHARAHARTHTHTQKNKTLLQEATCPLWAGLHLHTSECSNENVTASASGNLSWFFYAGHRTTGASKIAANFGATIITCRLRMPTQGQLLLSVFAAIWV